MNRRKYTAEHLQVLAELYKRMKVEDVTQVFNERFGMDCTVAAIKTVLRKNDIRCGRGYGERLVTRRYLFDPAHEAYIRSIAHGRTRPEITRRVNETYNTAYTVSQVDALMSRRKIYSGRDGRFKPGGAPWNTGTKGKTGRNATSFKPGVVPPNRRPMYSERVTAEGFVEIKVPERNPYTGSPVRWRHKHAWIWEQHNGRPVPDGHVVIFKNSDKSDMRLENLALISRAELLEINQMQYSDTPGPVRDSVLALAKLKVKTREVGKERSV